MKSEEDYRIEAYEKVSLILQKVKREGDFKQFEYNGYICQIRRNPYFGNLCGYVGVLPEDTNFYMKTYNDIEDKYGEDINVHGGLTFSNFWDNKDDPRWYIGFDCAHAGDMCPGSYQKYPNIYINKFRTLEYENYRDMTYVTKECKNLVDQIIEINKKKKENKIS
jgi:hypothetical protein